MPKTITRSETTQAANVQQWAEQLLAGFRESPGRLRPRDLAVLDAQRAALADAPSMAPTQPAKAAFAPIIVRDANALDEMSKAIAAASAVAIDLETSSLDPNEGEIVGIGLAMPGKVFYIPVAHRVENTAELVTDQLPLNAVVAAIGISETSFVAHNAKFESKWLRHHLGIKPRFVWDTMVAAKLLQSDRPAGLKEVAARELDVPDWSLKKAEISTVQYLPIERVAYYCGRDVDYTMQLLGRQQQCLA